MRRTSRLQDLVRHLGLALGGRPAQALARRLLVPASKDRFLRGARTMVGPASEPLRVIGIDDWAWRKGQRYGTVICDLERRQVIDLLPDREPATVKAWLRAHPDIRITARDRNGGYGGAATRALPEALQVADRWHLLENASAAFLGGLTAQHARHPQGDRGEDARSRAADGSGRAAIRRLSASPANQSDGEEDGR